MRFKNLVILLASIIFYSWGAPKFVFVILASTYIDFYIVKWLHQTNELKVKKRLLTLSISLNVGMLAFFKYANFFVENVNAVLTSLGFTDLAWTQIALPIGISFYTFQTLTYSIDVYRKVHAPLDKVQDYILYIMSFPQMIAGPIVRFNSIADQITSRSEKIDDKLIGFYRFIIGLTKKVLIANVMGEQAAAIMDGNISQLDSGTAWLGIIAYTFQIYFDFSGYSDMAIGLGRMMGFTFPENFNSPYTSKNISEFWRRWHITLGAFMRDYLYIPLGGNKGTSSKLLSFLPQSFHTYSNLWIVFLLSGLWHGASWNFVLWGAYHGLFLTLDRLFLIKLLNRFGSFISIVVTFIITIFGWVIFRIENISDIGIYMKKMLDFSSFHIPYVDSDFKAMLILAVIFSFITAFNFGRKMENFAFHRDSYSLKNYSVLTLLSVLFFIVCLSAIVSSGFNPFIYFRF